VNKSGATDQGRVPTILLLPVRTKCWKSTGYETWIFNLDKIPSLTSIFSLTKDLDFLVLLTQKSKLNHEWISSITSKLGIFDFRKAVWTRPKFVALRTFDTSTSTV
jgi:hypothetical protein